ncbi:hypothetical protein [Syntrophomonas palmitatica]|uniref:hypothetical protein n=1 Tax=Syntrophomonas palmitatica TaxID=402877 RepID=UPI0006CF708E|nr:hypothetical protein [Syntrophomonas palmitatica]
MKIINLEIMSIENPGCNNGNYPPWIGVKAETGEVVTGQTCNCLAGCSGQDRLEDYNPQDRTATLVI